MSKQKKKGFTLIELLAVIVVLAIILVIAVPKILEVIENAKLKAERVEETSKTIQEGYVISQEIEANESANAGDAIKIHVSIGTGIAQVVMPNVVGYSEENAKNALTGKNLTVTIEYSEDTSKNNGEVLSQSIEKGKNIDEGTEVTLVVNKLSETKTAKIIINLKSITGGYDTNADDKNVAGGTTVKEKKLTVKVGEDKVYEKNVDLNSTNIETKATGKGTVTVKVYVDDILKEQKEINLNTTESYTFE